MGIPTMRSQMARTTALPQTPKAGFRSKLRSNSRGWLHGAVLRKRHQMRHLCDLTCLLAKQVPSQLSYTPTGDRDRKSTRLNSSHLVISYAVFCLKKKKSTDTPARLRP